MVGDTVLKEHFMVMVSGKNPTLLRALSHGTLHYKHVVTLKSILSFVCLVSVFEGDNFSLLGKLQTLVNASNIWNFFP